MAITFYSTSIAEEGGGGDGLTLVDNNGDEVTGSTITVGPGEITHSYIRDANLLHRTFQYEQSSDPGAVGAGKWWLNKTLVEVLPDVFGYQLNYRNDANDGWITL